MPIILAVANFFGISVFRLVAYAVCVVAVVVALLVVRQHYVDLGWRKHAAAVAKQDDRAVEANKRVEEQADKCSDTNGFWDVVTQGCKLQQEEESK